MVRMLPESCSSMDNHAKYIIYGLVDPRASTVREGIRYVGKSSRGVNRPKAHSQLSHLKVDDNRCKADWILELRSLQLKPEIIVLEQFESTVASTEMNAAERAWIALARVQGCPLTNATDGGDGMRGHVHTDVSKRKMVKRAELRILEAARKSGDPRVITQESWTPAKAWWCGATAARGSLAEVHAITLSTKSQSATESWLGLLGRTIEQSARQRERGYLVATVRDPELARWWRVRTESEYKPLLLEIGSQESWIRDSFLRGYTDFTGSFSIRHCKSRGYPWMSATLSSSSSVLGSYLLDVIPGLSAQTSALNGIVLHVGWDAASRLVQRLIAAKPPNLGNTEFQAKLDAFTEEEHKSWHPCELCGDTCQGVARCRSCKVSKWRAGTCFCGGTLVNTAGSCPHCVKRNYYLERSKC